MDKKFPDNMDPRIRAKLEAVVSTPQAREIQARHNRVSEREPLAFAFVDGPLPEGVLAIVRLGQPAPLQRYAVVSRTGFDDEVYLRASLSAFAYEMEQESDTSPVTITTYRDGRVETASARHGQQTRNVPQKGAVGDPGRRSAPMLAALANAPVQDIPGYGRAHVLHQ